MSLTVICQSCGQRLDVGEEMARRKVRCPQCGVMCPVPESAGKGKSKAKPARAASQHPESPAPEADEDDIARQLLDMPDEPSAPPPPKREPTRKPRLQSGPPPKPDAPAPEPEPPPPPAPSRPTWDDDEDDGKPYLVEGGVDRKCPKCCRVVAADAVVCVDCGINLETGKKVGKTYEPIKRSWESGLPYVVRLKYFISFSVIALLLSITGAILKENLFVFLAPWIVFNGMLAFLLGTGFRLDFERDSKGRFDLKRTMYVCFILQKPEEVNLAEYLELVHGRAVDSGCLEWMVFILLLPAGLIVSALWWWYVIRPVKCYVALAKDHGFPEVMLYRGTDEARMREIGQTLGSAARLRFQG